MMFRLNGNLEGKFYDIFENVKEKSNIDNINHAHESPTTGLEYLKTIVSGDTLSDKDGSGIIPSKNTKYSCNVLLRIQSVFHSTKDKDKDIEYYSQVLLEKCCYDFFIDTRKIDPRFKRTNKLDPSLKRTNKPESEFESEEEINEYTVLDK